MILSSLTMLSPLDSSDSEEGDLPLPDGDQYPVWDLIDQVRQRRWTTSFLIHTRDQFRVALRLANDPGLPQFDPEGMERWRNGLLLAEELLSAALLILVDGPNNL